MKTAALALLVVLSLGHAAIADNAVPADAPTIKLLDAGKGPKKALRFTARVGMKRTLTTTMLMSMKISMGTTTMPVQKVPAIRMAMDLKVTDVAENGDIRYELVLRKPSVVPDKTTPKATIEALEVGLKGLEGLSGYALVTSRGFTKEADINVPLAASPQTRQYLDGVRQSVSQLAAPMPAEPVGVGATWETTTRLDQNGMKLEQTATNKLLELRGKRARLGITLTQTAKPQKITTNGMTVDLLSYAGRGAGSTTLELGGLIPSTARMELHSEMQMDTMGQKASLELDLVMTMKGK